MSEDIKPYKSYESAPGGYTESVLGGSSCTTIALNNKIFNLSKVTYFEIVKTKDSVIVCVGLDGGVTHKIKTKKRCVTVDDIRQLFIEKLHTVDIFNL